MDDVIYRQAAIDALGEKPLAWPEGEFEFGMQHQWQSDIDAIKALPSAQPERKKGKWIETSDGTMCGNCHKFPYDDGEYHIANWYSDFCPNCGAKMEEQK